MDVIESIKNLHFLRFYLQKDYFQHTTSSLAISSASQYYKLLEANKQLGEWNQNGYLDLLPNSYIDDKINIFDIFCFQKETTNPLWSDFYKVEKYYLDNSYRYQIIEKEKDIYFYQEYCNSILIKQLELEKDSLYWAVLQLCNRKIVSKQEIEEFFCNVSQEEIEETIKELFEERLLYVNANLTEIVSLINSDLTYV